MIQTEINVYKQDISQLGYKIKDKQEKIKDNKEKIKLNKQLPYLCAHVVEVRAGAAVRTHADRGSGQQQAALLCAVRCRSSALNAMPTRCADS